MNIYDTQMKIVGWAADRGIFDDADPIGQSIKNLEEAMETQRATYHEDIDGVKDGIGDQFVTLAILAQMHDLTLEECVEAAWDSIKDRKGSMKDGIFVKDEE